MAQEVEALRRQHRAQGVPVPEHEAVPGRDGLSGLRRFQAAATSAAASRKVRPMSISVLAMALPPGLDGLDEIVEQSIDIAEAVRRLPAFVMPMIALPAFVVEADHPNAVHDVDETILESMIGGRNRRRNPPQPVPRNPVRQGDAAANEEFRCMLAKYANSCRRQATMHRTRPTSWIRRPRSRKDRPPLELRARSERPGRASPSTLPQRRINQGHPGAARPPPARARP